MYFIYSIIRIINLETDVEKKQKITKEFNNYDLKYEVITGVDGLKYELTEDDLQYLKTLITISILTKE